MALQKQTKTVNGAWFVALGAILWGTTGTAQAFVPVGANPLTVGTMRILIGTFTLVIVSYWRGEIRFLWQWRDWPAHTTIFAAACVAAYQLFFFAAVAKSGIAVGTIVALGSAPIFAGILEWLRFRYMPTKKWFLATTFAICGCVFLIVSSGNLEINILGIFLAFCAGGSYAAYTFLSKGLLITKPQASVLVMTFSLGSLLLLPIILWGDFSWILAPRGIVVALHLGIITMGLAYYLFATGLKRTTVSTTATMTLAEPLTAGLLAIFVVGEQLTAVALIGIGLLLAGLLVLAFRPAK